MKRENMIVNKDCRYFKGDIPCKFHKESGVLCNDCNYFSKIDNKTLIIKLGAVGDVIRTTPLLHRLRKDYPDSEIYWLTYFPDVVPKSVDNVLNFELKNIIYLQSVKFDILINLDKDREACALTNQIEAEIKKGFMLMDGRCAPINNDSANKWMTGISDDLNRNNTKSYLDEIFEICDYEFYGEKYIFELDDKYEWNINESRPLIGLNTGCGERWTTRLWETNNWIELAKKLKSSGFGVVLLGGVSEDEKNRLISEKSGAAYLGHFPLDQFFSLINQCDVVVTAVSMALHVAIGLGKKVALFNNIFNKKEFEMYGLGDIIEPDLECLGCFKTKFDAKCKVSNCMELIFPQQVLDIIKRVV